MSPGALIPIPRGTLLVERFAIRRKLGRGGMATVYEAEDVRLRQSVAVKVLSPVFATDSGAVERFLREARAVVRLRNQHVVRVIDAGMLDQGAPYLVMEYLDGESLAALLAQRGPVPAHGVVDYALQALEALAEAHRAGIVHRDLKPDNLMLLRSEDDLPQIKVIDFGISKLVGPEFTIKNLTLESSFLGSPLYASPEQLRDTGKVDARTDIWSLGVVMYELLTGRPPFDVRSPSALMTAICEGTPARVDDLQRSVPAPLADVVMRCLQKEPEQRYADARELARALAPFAPDARSRLSVEHIVRVQSVAPPAPLQLPVPASSTEDPTTPSMTPAWSSVSEGPETTVVEAPRTRLRQVALVFGAAAIAGFIAALVAHSRWLLPNSRPTRVAARSTEGTSAGVPVSAASALAHESVTLPAVSVAAPLPGRPVSRAAAATSAKRGAELESASPAGAARPPGVSHARSGQPVGVALPARPLDTTNPFQH